MIAKLQEPIRHIASGFISMPIDLPGTNFSRAIRASKHIKKELESIVLQRKMDLMNLNLIDPCATAPRDRISSLLMERYSDGEEMTEVDIANKMYALLLGAYDTIIVTLCSMSCFYHSFVKFMMPSLRYIQGGTRIANWG